MNERRCTGDCGDDRRPGDRARSGQSNRPGGGARLCGLLLVLALLFSGDFVRIHGHGDGAPATTDCAACLATLASAVEAAPPPALDPPVPAAADRFHALFFATPPLLFVRQGGLRDPPRLFA